MMRLQRFLAQAGLASRRKAEELILAGRVRVNGKVVRELGTSVDPRADRVDCDNRRVVPEERVWVLLNKPDGTVCTAQDPQGRPTALDLVQPQHCRLFSVGRLDYHSQGALLLTNDGDLAGALTHPRSHVPRVYHVKVKGLVAPTQLEALRQGVSIEGGVTVAAEARVVGDTGNHTWIEMTLHQGVNRQIHRMLEAVGLRVLKLLRVTFAGIGVEGLRPGEHRLLTQRELDALRKLVQLSGQTQRQRPAGTGRREARGTPAPGRKTPTHQKAPPERRKAPAGRKAPERTKAPARQQAPAGQGAARPASATHEERGRGKRGRAVSDRGPARRGRARR